MTHETAVAVLMAHLVNAETYMLSYKGQAEAMQAEANKIRIRYECKLAESMQLRAAILALGGTLPEPKVGADS